MNQEELIREYQNIHKQGEQMWGTTTYKNRHMVEHQIRVIEHRIGKIKSSLDYGCGKGWQYSKKLVHKDWGIDLPTLYDPCVAGLDIKPQGQFDIVICIDVLEHVHPDSVDDTLQEIINYSKKALIFNIAVRPAIKKFKDGTNYHTTIESKKWWRDKIRKYKDHRIVLMTHV